AGATVPYITYLYNADGVLIGKTDDTSEYTYYANENNRMETKKLLVDGDDLAGTIYEYSDEAVSEIGTNGEYGHLIKQTNPDGSYKTFGGYFGEKKPKYIKEYAPGATDPDVTYEYDMHGLLAEKTDHITGDYYTYFPYASNRMATKTLPDGTIYKYYNESFYDNNTQDTSDDYGRCYQNVTNYEKTFTYEAYYVNTDLPAKISEESIYPGDLYYFYKNYTINYDDDADNEIGFRKQDADGGASYDFVLQDGKYYLHKKIDSNGTTYWYLWDGLETINELGWGLMFSTPTYWSQGKWVAYLFDLDSEDSMNPEVDWTAFPLQEPVDKPGLGTWPLSNVDYPTAGTPESCMIETECVDYSSTVSFDADSFIDYVEEMRTVTTGAGVTIAFLDTGIDQDLLNIDIIDSCDFTETIDFENSFDEYYADLMTHGSKTASVVKGEGDKGVAPGVDVMDLKVIDDSGNISSEAVAEAIYYAADNGADIITMSFSLFPIHDSLKEALDYAFEKGSILITSAGNEGSSILDNSLADQGNILTVGSFDSDGSICAWSNYGTDVDLFAPWDVVTIDSISENEAGTSFSAAFISGVTALMLSENPDMTQEDVLCKLKNICGDKSEDDQYELFMAKQYKNGEPRAKDIKGANVMEVISRYESERKNQSQFTGAPIVTDIYTVSNEM
ncbi:MAG: S8/S53 family peptidase, partial [Candidatus Omnitrophota bacterium]